MKKIIFLCVLSCIVATSCGDDEQKLKAPSNGLVAYYDFNGNSNDQVGTNDGTDTNVTYTSAGKKNKAAEFSGSDSYIMLPNDFDFQQRTISFSFLGKNALDNWYTIYASDNANTQFGKTLITLDWTGIAITVRFNVSDNIVGKSIDLNKWYTVALVVDGKSYRYYIDGELLAEDVFTEYVNTESGSENAWIGGDAASNHFFDGQVDNLRIYNRALTEKEIKTLAKL